MAGVSHLRAASTSGSFRQAGMAAVARGLGLPVTAGATLVTTSLAIGYAGATVYGYISLISMLFQLIPFADLGLGAAIISAVARRHSSPADDVAAQVVSRAAFRILCLSGIAVLAMAAVLGSLGLWTSILRLPPGLSSYAAMAVVAAIAPFAASLPLGIGQRILLGEGKNHVVSLLAVVGPVAATGVTAVLVAAHVPPLYLAAAAPSGVFATAAVTFYFAFRSTGWDRRGLFDRLQKRPARPHIWNSAAAMLVINITIPIGMQSDRLVLTQMTGGLTLAHYSLAAQFYAPTFSLLSAAAVSLWPAFARQTNYAAKLTLWKRALAVMGTAGVAAGGLYYLLVRPVGLWLSHGTVHIGVSLALAFACLVLVMSIHQPSAMMLTEPKLLAFQAYCCAAMLPVNIGLSILLVGRVGAAGAVWGSAIAVLLVQAIPAMVRARTELSAAARERESREYAR